MQDGEGESGGLAGAGLGLTDHILAREHGRDDGGLDRRRGFVAKRGYRLHQFGMQTKVFEVFCCHDFLLAVCGLVVFASPLRVMPLLAA